MTRVALVIATLTAAASLVSCTRPGCYEEKVGEGYTCTCPRRCNFQDSTFSTSLRCERDNAAAVQAALGQCGASCSPSATCSSCTCTSTGEACYQEHCPR